MSIQYLSLKGREDGEWISSHCTGYLNLRKVEAHLYCYLGHVWLTNSLRKRKQFSLRIWKTCAWQLKILISEKNRVFYYERKRLESLLIGFENPQHCGCLHYYQNWHHAARISKSSCSHLPVFLSNETKTWASWEILYFRGFLNYYQTCCKPVCLHRIHWDRIYMNSRPNEVQLWIVKELLEEKDIREKMRLTACIFCTTTCLKDFVATKTSVLPRRGRTWTSFTICANQETEKADLRFSFIGFRTPYLLPF